ncbi:winged helix-turn-helix domain-containing protein [Bifidobacterium leontopitheci]|nr:helix-turn-helix domain-containing protein [Bifidobacterium leontopitheci]
MTYTDNEHSGAAATSAVAPAVGEPPAAAADEPVDFPAEIAITDPKTIRLISNPIRMIVMNELFGGPEPRTAKELGRIAGISSSAMSYHLHLLGKAGLIHRVDSDRDGRESPWAPSAQSFSIAVSEQRDSGVRMKVMDGVLKTLRMRINDIMDVSAAMPMKERRRRLPFTPMSTGTLRLTRAELIEAQQRINAVWEEYMQRGEQRKDGEYDYQVAYAWSCLPSDVRGLLDGGDGKGGAGGTVGSAGAVGTAGAAEK